MKHKCNKLREEIEIEFHEELKQWYMIQDFEWSCFGISYCPFCGEKL